MCTLWIVYMWSCIVLEQNEFLTLSKDQLSAPRYNVFCKDVIDHIQESRAQKQNIFVDNVFKYLETIPSQNI